MIRTFALNSVIMSLLVMSAVSLSGLAMADEGDRPQVSVTGTAVTCVTPDQIIWSITTTDDNVDLAKAKHAARRS